ncbi:uncharacterized protein LOC117644286 [Thrips palmi]|uniref:Uncharacterized protein LOC117644286 n=1 Tax=Thrips palmi TaxID=161013 RepID=A0A6P8YR87_THRPL|nr:uncharacterized protein LOC117644286 [Thrips palmi]
MDSIPASPLPCQEERKFPTNTVCSVHIQWIENDGSLWVLLSPEVETMEYVSQYLADCANFDGLNSIAVGDVVSAFDADDGCWYRAKILKTDPLTIKFIDFGNVARVTPEFVAALPPDLSLIHELAIHVKLAPESNIIPCLGDELLVNYVTSDNGIAVVSVEVPVETQAPVELVAPLPPALPGVVVTEHISDTVLKETMPTVSSELKTSDAGFDLDSETKDIIFESSIDSNETIVVTESVTADVCNSMQSGLLDSSEVLASVPVATVLALDSEKPPQAADEGNSMQSGLLDSSEVLASVPVATVLALDSEKSPQAADEGNSMQSGLLDSSEVLASVPVATVLALDSEKSPQAADEGNSMQSGLLDSSEVLASVPVATVLALDSEKSPQAADEGNSMQSGLLDSSEVLASVPVATVLALDSEKSPQAADEGNSMQPELPDTNAPPDDVLGFLGVSSSAVATAAPVEATLTPISIDKEISTVQGVAAATDFPMKTTLPTAPGDQELSLLHPPKKQPEFCSDSSKPIFASPGEPVVDTFVYSPMEAALQTMASGQELIVPCPPPELQDAKSDSYEQVSVLLRKGVADPVCITPKERRMGSISNNIRSDSPKTVSVPPAVPTEVVSGSSLEDVSDVISHAFEKGITKVVSNPPKIVNGSLNSVLNASAKAFTISETPSSHGQHVRKKETKRDTSEFSHHFELSIIQEQLRLQMLQLQKRIEQDVAYQINCLKQEMSRQIGHQMATLFADVAMIKNDIQMGRCSERRPPMNSVQCQNSNLSTNEQPFQHQASALQKNTHQFYGYETASHLGMDYSYSHDLPSELQSFKANDRETHLNKLKVDSIEPSTSETIEKPSVLKSASKLVYVTKIAKDVTLDHLFTLFGLYGNVLKIKKMSPVSAVIEMGDPAQADLAVRYLNFAPLKGLKLHVNLSKFSTIFTNREDYEAGLVKDFSKSRLNRFKAGRMDWDADKLSPPCNRLRTNVTKSTSDDKIKDIFKSKGHHVAINSVPGRTSETKTLYISLNSTEEAINALCELHYAEYDDWSHMHITFARPSKF